MIEQLERQLSQQLTQSPKSPKYLCLRDAVIDLIVDGTLPEGTRLPTEQALAGTLPVSLGTIQKALKVLVDSGDLVRKRRMGTFVAEGDHRRAIGTPAFQFLRPDGAVVKMVFIKLLKREPVDRDGPWTEVLGDCDEGYLHLVRQDRIDGAFYCHTDLYLRADFAGNLMTVPTDQLEHESLVPLLQEAGVIHHWTAENRLAQVRLPKPLHTTIYPDGAPDTPLGLKLDTRYQSEDERPFAWQVMHIPLNDYSLSLTTRSR
ncbi:GntR family transcriptional regulator [Saccharospirillum salsuginis]|uniref:GntR family transcriptional regulator n=1 Tax=Saccharospirillum salsuginis TaxID=418750 RepID=A0A918K4A0_9GAMM|nr:GntR family transcriptional regulator [Saccharospirillum salsuginis]GGX45138.1 GntR family transcriptional regulator [Saccharospirillum salsuginis]